MAPTPWSSKLLHKAAMRLRTANLWATNLRLSVKFAVPKDVSARQHNSGIPQLAGRESTPLVECQDNQTLTEGLKKAMGKDASGAELLKAVLRGVTLSNLVPDHLHRSICSPGWTGGAANEPVADDGQHQQEARDDDAVLREHAAGGHSGADADCVYEYSGFVLKCDRLYGPIGSLRDRSDGPSVRILARGGFAMAKTLANTADCEEIRRRIAALDAGCAAAVGIDVRGRHAVPCG